MGKDELVTQSAALLGKYIRKTSSKVSGKRREVLSMYCTQSDYLGITYFISFHSCGVVWVDTFSN